MLHLKNIRWLLKQDVGTSEKHRQVLTLVVTCIVTHYINYGFVCVQEAYKAGILSAEEHSDLRNFLTSFTYLPRLFGKAITRLRVSNYFFILSEIFAGVKSHKQGTPKTNEVHENPRLWAKASNLPHFLARRHTEDYKMLANHRFDFE
jgi:hypothetical protein